MPTGWSDDYNLSPQIDACLLGGQMYRGYEGYWTAVAQAGSGPLPMTGKSPTPAELAWSQTAGRTPHYVLSTTLPAAQRPNTTVLRNVEDVAALKRQEGKDIYLMGGARLTANLMDAGLVDELRLIVYPLLAGEGKALFSAGPTRRALRREELKGHPDGRVMVTYAILDPAAEEEGRF